MAGKGGFPNADPPSIVYTGGHARDRSRRQHVGGAGPPGRRCSIRAPRTQVRSAGLRRRLCGPGESFGCGRRLPRCMGARARANRGVPEPGSVRLLAAPDRSQSSPQLRTLPEGPGDGAARGRVWARWPTRPGRPEPGMAPAPTAGPARAGNGEADRWSAGGIAPARLGGLEASSDCGSHRHLGGDVSAASLPGPGSNAAAAGGSRPRR